MKFSQYRVVTEKTNLESFNDGADSVVIEWNGEQKTIRTFTSGSCACDSPSACRPPRRMSPACER